MHLIVLALFLISYLQFKSNAASYPLSAGWQAIKTWLFYSYSQIYTIKWAGIWDYKNTDIFFYVNIVISILLISYIFIINLKYLDEKEKPRYHLELILWWIFLSAWLNIPVALTANYQSWVAGGSRAYLYSALSNFTVAIGIGLIVLCALKKFSKSKYLIVFLFLSMIFIYINHAIRSYKVYREQMYSHERWKFVDQMARDQAFKATSCYIAPWLFELNGIVMIRTGGYWKQYLSETWGINSNIISAQTEYVCQDYETILDP